MPTRVCISTKNVGVIYLVWQKNRTRSKLVSICRCTCCVPVRVICFDNTIHMRYMRIGVWVRNPIVSSYLRVPLGWACMRARMRCRCILSPTPCHRHRRRHHYRSLIQSLQGKVAELVEKNKQLRTINHTLQSLLLSRQHMNSMSLNMPPQRRIGGMAPFGAQDTADSLAGIGGFAAGGLPRFSGEKTKTRLSLSLPPSLFLPLRSVHSPLLSLYYPMFLSHFCLTSTPGSLFAPTRSHVYPVLVVCSRGSHHVCPLSLLLSNGPSHK